MKIQFQKKDADYYKIEELRKQIASITSKYPVFIEIVATVLLELYEASNQLTKELSDLMDMSKFLVDESKYEDYKKLKDMLIEYYMLIQDFNFDSNLQAKNPDEYRNYKLYDNQKKMNVFRGILFEAIVEELARERFNIGQFETGCCVLINGNKVFVRYGNGNIKETFDIAGWNCDVPWGEFYECKLRPDKFKIENYELMLQLENCLRRNMISNYKIIVASADAEKNIVQQIVQLEAEISSKVNKIECFGRESIQRIYEISVPIIA